MQQYRTSLNNLQRIEIMHHILLKTSTRRPYFAVPELPHGIHYDSVLGFWITEHTPLVTTREFLHGGCNSKKCDQETGEDQKGE